jgi:hypothetical protein
LELGKVLQDLELAGQTIPEICKRCTFSEQYIRDILALSYAPGIIQEMIIEGNVSSSIVIKAMKETDNEAELVEIINSAKDQETGKISPAKVKKTIQESKGITGESKPVKSNSKGLEQAEKVLMELHAKTGLDSMLWIWEAIQGNMSVSSIVLNVKSEIHN